MSIDLNHEIVTDAITAWQERADANTAALLAEQERKFERVKRLIARTIQTAATSNSIGEAADDLLEEFGLPRRGPSGYVWAWLQVETPVLRENVDSYFVRRLNSSGGAHLWVPGEYGPVDRRVSAMLPDEGDRATCFCPVDEDDILNFGHSLAKETFDGNLSEEVPEGFSGSESSYEYLVRYRGVRLGCGGHSCRNGGQNHDEATVHMVPPGWTPSTVDKAVML